MKKRLLALFLTPIVLFVAVSAGYYYGVLDTKNKDCKRWCAWRVDVFGFEAYNACNQLCDGITQEIVDCMVGINNSDTIQPSIADPAPAPQPKQPPPTKESL